ARDHAGIVEARDLDACAEAAGAVASDRHAQVDEIARVDVEDAAAGEGVRGHAAGDLDDLRRSALQGTVQTVDRQVDRLARAVHDIAVHIEEVTDAVEQADIEVDRAVSAEVAGDQEHVVGRAVDEADHAIVVQRRCPGTHVDQAEVAGADRAGIVETVAVGTAVAQVDAAKRQVDRAAGTIVDVVVAATEVRGAVPDQPGAAIAIGETV